MSLKCLRARTQRRSDLDVDTFVWIVATIWATAYANKLALCSFQHLKKQWQIVVHKLFNTIDVLASFV